MSVFGEGLTLLEDGHKVMMMMNQCIDVSKFWIVIVYKLRKKTPFYSSSSFRAYSTGALLCPQYVAIRLE